MRSRGLGGLARGADRLLHRLVPTVVALCCLVNACGSRRPEQSAVPAAILELDGGAEDVFDFAVAGQWRRAAARTTALRETIARLEAEEGRRFPELERAVSELDRAVGAHETRRSGCCANEVVRQAVRLASSDLGQDRAATLLLEVEAREVLIQAEGDPVAADEAVARIAELWTLLRPEVERHGGSDLVASGDAHVARLRTGEPSTRRGEARGLLETVDELEGLRMR